MVKIIGFIIVIISGTLGGFAVYEKQRNKLKFFRQYLDFIENIKNEIRYSGKNLFDILSTYRCEYPFKIYIDKSIDNLSKFSFEDSWKKSFKLCVKDLGISDSEESLIVNFGLGLGKSDTQSQISHCEHNLQMAKPHLKKLQDDYHSKGKLPLIVGTGCGIVIALLIV